MQIVIEIPEDEYQHIMRHYEQFPRDLSRYERRIIDGTLLPKRHGRLIDADATKCSSCGKFGCENSDICSLYNAPTIIEADGDNVE